MQVQEQRRKEKLVVTVGHTSRVEGKKRKVGSYSSTYIQRRRKEK